LALRRRLVPALALARRERADVAGYPGDHGHPAAERGEEEEAGAEHGGLPPQRAHRLPQELGRLANALHSSWWSRSVN